MGGRKPLSLLLAITSVALTACSQDDEIVTPAQTELQVQVSTIQHSRTPVHDTALPDNSPIGVFLYTPDAADGSNFYNVPYAGTTTDGVQTWQPQGKPVTLAQGEATACAYWPYNPEAGDMTAVPVETASQSDYMYSGTLTGISKENPQAAFEMKHAMTLVRVVVAKDTYTGNGAMTELAVASPAFATSATMDVATGALAGLDGVGSTFTTALTDAVVTTEGCTTEFLVLPDTGVGTADVVFSATVDGTVYTASIQATEAFSQGYVYTYTLTIDNAEMSVTSISVTPWQETPFVEVPEPVQQNDQYIVRIEVSSDNYTYKHNVVNFVGTIDWGDGSKTVYENSTSGPSHVYAAKGNYIITAIGTATGLNSYFYYNNYASPCITDIIKVGDIGITSMASAFYEQTKLKSITPGAFDGLKNVTSFESTFSGCSSLTTIPQGLFDKCTKVTNFEWTYSQCSALTTIPKGLFDNNPNVTTFDHTFYQCTSLTTIPTGLFDNNTLVTNFDYTFYQCTSLTEIPLIFSNNPNVTDFEYTFFDCSSLTAIPEGLFDNCPEVTSFQSTFSSCSALTAIPDGLFDNNTNVTDFIATFRSTGITAIPQGLFDMCPLVTDFSFTFSSCSTLTAIPDGLFDSCTEVTTFENTFYNCSSLTAIPQGLFNNCTKVTDFIATFGSTGITAIPEGLFDNCPNITNFGSNYYNYSDGTFYKCSNLTTIPTGLFDNNPNVKSFSGTFGYCTSLTTIPNGLFDNNPNVTDFSGTFSRTGITAIPQGLFDNNPNVTTFEYTFGSCSKLAAIPEGLFDGCPNVKIFSSTFRSTSITAIPQGLFDNNPNVTHFSWTFSSCSALTAIPEGLFDNNPLVEYFGSTFSGCKNITAIPKGLFDNCPNVTSFSGTFNGTGITAIPEGLFDNNPLVEWFGSGGDKSYGTFAYCSSLTTIPTGLFDNCTKVTNFSYTFYYCSKLTGESPYTVINVDGEDKKVHLYERPLYPDYFTKPTYYTDCYQSCSGLTDWAAIVAAGWN